MTNKTKLELNELEVKSFTTGNVKGGLSGPICIALTIGVTTVTPATTELIDDIPPVDHSESRGRIYCPSDSTC